MFHAALECEPGGRAVFLAQSCPDDPSLQAEVTLLLAAHEQAASFMETPAWEPIDPGIKPDATDALVGRHLGNYRLIRLIGLGGMGVVYEAEQQNPRRAVALKVLGGGPCVDPHRVKRFRCEVQALAQLKHPAIATIYEAGRTQEGQHFFTMELVDGVPLHVYVREKSVPPRQRLEVFRRICEAIHYAHQHGVIHQDLKPSNILVDAEGHPKILDFGLARITHADFPLTLTLSETGGVAGTLPYMSPERARGHTQIDGRSDVYSLGVILFELMTGALPYGQTLRGPYEALRAICEEMPRKPSTLNGALRGEMETIMLKTLEKEPSRRYESAAALAGDIERHLTRRPIHARPPALGYRLGRLAIRYKVWAVLAAALLGFVGLWYSVILPLAGRVPPTPGPKAFWPQDFEDFPPVIGKLPKRWNAGPGNDLVGVLDMKAHQGSRAFLLFGALGQTEGHKGGWTAQVAVPLTGPDHPGVHVKSFVLKFAMRCGGEEPSGGRPQGATLTLSNLLILSDERAPERTGHELLSVRADGSLWGPGPTGKDLGPMSFGVWHTAQIGYTRVDAQKVRIEYWLDGDHLPTQEVPADPHEDELIWLVWAVDEGSAWFDSIRFEGGGYTWQEDFENVGPGIPSLPRGWEPLYGNEEYGVLELVPGKDRQALYLYGSPESPPPEDGLRLSPEGGWPGVVGSPIVGSVAYASEFVVDFLLRNGREELVGPCGYRARLDMQTLSAAQESVKNQGQKRTLFRVLDDGTIVGANGEPLGRMRLDPWHQVRIHYKADHEAQPETVLLQYWLDEQPLGEQTVPATAYEHDLFWFHWMAGEGSVWFDDITVRIGPDSASFSQHPRLADQSRTHIVR
ncbi:MAG: serine/threonine-protein kinase [Planctomycetota bacterium]